MNWLIDWRCMLTARCVHLCVENFLSEVKKCKLMIITILNISKRIEAFWWGRGSERKVNLLIIGSEKNFHMLMV